MRQTQATSGSINETIADKLDEMATLLESQHEDGFRIRAYRRAAQTLRVLPEPVDETLRSGGVKALVALPDIGERIAAAIAEMISTGRWVQLERVAGELDPEQLLQTLPGVGPQLAARLHHVLDVESLEELELAAHDGRLAAVPGIGPARAELLRAVLHERLGARRLRAVSPAAAAPEAKILLDVDREYREKAAGGELRRISPKRFNPEHRAWLPILHTRRGEWEFTALYSNTARAHELGRTDDWVVIYAHLEGSPERQSTVVTETHGPLVGRRVVRGRESECV